MDLLSHDELDAITVEGLNAMGDLTITDSERFSHLLDLAVGSSAIGAHEHIPRGEQPNILGQYTLNYWRSTPICSGVHHHSVRPCSSGADERRCSLVSMPYFDRKSRQYLMHIIFQARTGRTWI